MSKKDDTDFYLGMAAPFLLAAWLIPLAIFRAWVITMLWIWYVVPGFGVPPLRIAIAFGLSVLIGMFTPIARNKDETFLELFAKTIFAQIIPLAFGWVGSFFV